MKEKIKKIFPTTFAFAITITFLALLFGLRELLIPFNIYGEPTNKELGELLIKITIPLLFVYGIVGFVLFIGYLENEENNS